jgi:outer membrane receptor protein involved in Fe transport
MKRLMIAAALTAAGPAHAWQTPTTPQIQVTASRLDQRRDASAAIATVAHDELTSHGDTSLSAALARVPGVTVRGSDIRLRGLGNGYTQLLLNGEPVPAGFSLDALPPDAVERIEVLRSASADQSTQGIAGSINIVLRRKLARAQSEVKMGLASHAGLVGGNAAATVGAEGRVLALTLERARLVDRTASEVADTQGQRIVTRREAPERTWLTLAPRIAAGALAWQGFARLGHVQVASDLDEELLRGTGSTYPRNGSRYDMRPITLRSDLTWTRQLDNGARLDLRALLDFLHRRSDFQFDGQGLQSSHREVQATADERGLGFTRKYTLGAVVAGWDVARSHRDETRREQRYEGGGFGSTDEQFGAALRRNAVFVQWEAELGRGLTVAPGLRWEEGARPRVTTVWKFSPQRERRGRRART